MINLDALQRDRDAKASAASSLLERTMQTAEAEKREITDDETAAIKSAAAEVRALDARIAANKSQDALIDEIRGMGTPRPAATAPALVRGYQSLGDQFVNHPSYDFFRKGQHRSSSVWRSPAIELDPGARGRVVRGQVPGRDVDVRSRLGRVVDRAPVPPRGPGSPDASPRDRGPVRIRDHGL